MIQFDIPEEVIKIDADIKDTDSVDVDVGVSGVIHEVLDDYVRIRNKPQINEVELVGNKTSEELGLLGEERAISIDEIMAICQ